MKRRTFLARTGQLAVLGTPGAQALLRRERVPAFLAKREEETLAAVLDLVFPETADAPGAREIRASEYLFSIIADPDIPESERSFLLKGISWVDDKARTMEGAAFTALSPEKRRAVFEAFVADENGENWLSNVISYALEALFGDPAYGVNVNQIGWKWIEHHGGFPHPPGPKWFKKL